MDAMSERRMVENEILARRRNEKTLELFSELKRTAEEEGWQEGWVKPPEIALLFHCECSDANCTERIPIKLTAYNKIHESRDCFTVAKGHAALSVERVVKERKQYSVVKKHKAYAVDKLAKTY